MDQTIQRLIGQKLPLCHFLQEQVYYNFRWDGDLRHQSQVSGMFQHYQSDRFADMVLAGAEDEQLRIDRGQKKPRGCADGEVHGGVGRHEHQKIIFERFCLPRPEGTTLVPQGVQSLRQINNRQHHERYRQTPHADPLQTNPQNSPPLLLVILR